MGKVTVAGLVLKIRSLTNIKEKDTDPVKQNQLIDQRNKLMSYITGLGIGVGTNDDALLKILKSFKR